MIDANQNESAVLAEKPALFTCYIMLRNSSSLDAPRIMPLESLRNMLKAST